MLDFFNIDSLLSEEERAVRASVRAFVDEHVLPVIGMTRAFQPDYFVNQTASGRSRA